MTARLLFAGDCGLVRDGLQLNGRGKRRLGQLYTRVSGLDVGGSAGSKKLKKFWKIEITERGKPGKLWDHRLKNRRLYMKLMGQ